MPAKKRPAKRKASPPRPATKAARAKPTKPARAKPARAKPKPARAKPAHREATPEVTGDALAEHNRLRALMGLPAVDRPIVADPALSEGNKMQSLAGKASALEIMDALYAGEGPVPPTDRIICWWGQFSAELPAPFTLEYGGHGFAEAPDLECATIAFAKLRNWVLAHETQSDDNLKLTRTREWAGISDAGQAWYRWMLADERQMTVLFKKPSQLTKSQRGQRRVKL